MEGFCGYLFVGMLPGSLFRQWMYTGFPMMVQEKYSTESQIRKKINKNSLLTVNGCWL